MAIDIISTSHAPSSAAYAQAVQAGPFVFVSGTPGIDPATGLLAGPTIQAQARQALRNCSAILRAAGAGLDDVVEVMALLADPADRDGLNAAVEEVFPVPPARCTARLGVEVPGLLVSIRMTAYSDRLYVGSVGGRERA